MKIFLSHSRYLLWSILTLVFLASCGDDRDEILGPDVVDSLPPTVITFTPANNAIGVSPVAPGITVTFSEPMAPITGDASFTVTCQAPCTNPEGTVSLNGENTVATYTLNAGSELEGNTSYTATISKAASLGTGLTLEQATVWTFTTAARPQVIAVAPVNNATGVPTNITGITAEFTEPMAPLTGEASFTLTCDAPCTNPAGTVNLDSTNEVATFSLNAPLEPDTLYTATITAGEGLETGLAMGAPFVWSFTTGLNADITRPQVTETSPETTDPGPTLDVLVDTIILATFTEDMAPITITEPGTFTLTCEAPCVSPDGIVSYSVRSRTATFNLTPEGSVLEPNTTYTATITTAATDLAGNALAGNQDTLPAASNYIWTFTTVARPQVTAVAPINNATGVPTNLTEITADFTEPVAPLTDDASFVLTCEAPCTNPTGNVTLDSSSEVATFTLTTGTTLEDETTYTATVSGAESLATGLTMAEPFVWSFTTGLTPDTTRPRVSSTIPETTDPGPTIGVPINTSITATFTEDMAPITITDPGTFTLTCEAPCVSPDGIVSYSVGSRTATFALTPAGTELEPDTTYTATITTAATDLAGNALAGNQEPLPTASDYIWTFTTVSAAIPPANITILSVKPANADVGVCPNATINATFDVSSGLQMDPDTINALTFTVFETNSPLNTVTAGSIVLDGANDIATFTPQNDLVDGVEYTAAVKGGENGVKDLAVPANIMVEDFVWSFHVGPATGDCLQPVSLNTAAPFGMLAGSAGMTNQGIQTIVNGDLGTTATATTAVTGFRDSNGDVYTVTGANDGIVNGIIFSCTTSTTGPTSAAVNADNCNAATIARNDAIDAFNELAGLPGGPDPAFGSPKGNLANEVLTPGVYTSESGSFLIEGGDLTLDAQGDANAVWVFQMATSLTVGGPGVASPQSIILINGAQAKNVFWQVGSSATINAAGGGTMVGTIIASTGVAFSTAGNVNIVTLDGRAMSLNASVTLVNTIINVPAQ